MKQGFQTGKCRKTKQDMSDRASTKSADNRQASHSGGNEQRNVEGDVFGELGWSHLIYDFVGINLLLF